MVCKKHLSTEIVCCLFTLHRCDVKQSEEETVAPAMLFDVISLLEVLIAAVYFFAFLFLDALIFSLRALACGVVD